jgi:hypothetical protein
MIDYRIPALLLCRAEAAGTRGKRQWMCVAPPCCRRRGSVVVRHSRAVVTGLAVERRQAAVQGDGGKTKDERGKAHALCMSSIGSWFRVGLDIVGITDGVIRHGFKH